MYNITVSVFFLQILFTFTLYLRVYDSYLKGTKVRKSIFKTVVYITFIYYFICNNVQFAYLVKNKVVNYSLIKYNFFFQQNIFEIK